MSATQTQPALPPTDGNGDGPEKHGHSRHPHALSESDLPKDLHRPATGTVVVAVVVVVGLMAGLFVLGWIPHHRAAEQAAADAKDQISAAPVVTVAPPSAEPSSKDIFLPCDVKANQQTAIYARATGYLKQWLVDFGGHVKRGQLLAVIDAPDVDAQLAQAKAALQQAKATLDKDLADAQTAQTDYNRYLTAQKENPGSVTQQDVDAKRDAYADAAAAVEVGKANVTQSDASVQQLAVEQGFEQITAPFDGTITARNYDVGALINPGDTGAGKELFDIADTQTLRVDVQAPQSHATEIQIGQAAYMKVRNYPTREFKGTVARQTNALDPATRTLTFELDFTNSDGALYAGMYGQARLPITEARPTLTIPSSALIFDSSGVRVAVVRDGRIHFQPVTVGRDLGTELEITDGLSPDDLVVGNPGERLAEGGGVQFSSASKFVTAQQSAPPPHAGAN